MLAIGSLATACGSDHAAAVASGGADVEDASTDGAADMGNASAADSAADSGADSAPAMTARACDDGLKSLDLGALTTITLVKAFKSGDALSARHPRARRTPQARADVCLVKIIVGPGNPGPVDAPSTSSGIGIEVWLPAHASWNERYQAFGGAPWKVDPPSHPSPRSARSFRAIRWPGDVRLRGFCHRRRAQQSGRRSP